MPKGIDTAFASMSEFRVSESMLTSFDFDVQKWRHLIYLDLMGNRLKSIHDSVWSHPHLMNLLLDDNVGLQIPSSESLAISLPNLQSFFFMYNSAHIPRDVFNNKNFPILLLLYLNGNIMTTFPDSFESLKNKVSAVGVARMGLTKLPSYLSDFSRLTYIDLRDNNITSVDSDLSTMISRNQITAYFSGNDVCQTPSAKFLDCVPLCSKFCWNRNHGTNKYCDRSCNSALCDFDWGECSSN
jgi:Leucine-rich repeat (LRR) protein